MNYKNVIPYLGQRRNEALKDSEEYQLINLSGWANYTPERLERLEQMWKAGKIKTHPVMISNDFYWIDVPTTSQWSHIFREDDLPSVEKKDGPYFYQEWHDKSNEEKRKTGPSKIIYDSSMNPLEYVWSGGGVGLHAKITDEKYWYGSKKVSKEEYNNAVKQYYPDAKSIYEL